MNMRESNGFVLIVGLMYLCNFSTRVWPSRKCMYAYDPDTNEYKWVDINSGLIHNIDKIEVIGWVDIDSGVVHSADDILK